MRKMTIERISGLILILTGIGIFMGIEKLDLSMFIIPSAVGIVLGITLGGTLMASRSSDIKKFGLAIRHSFSHGIKIDETELKIYVRLFTTFSRYSMIGGWFGFLLGIICIFVRLPEYLNQGSNIGLLTDSVSTSLIPLVYGVFLSKCFFGPIKDCFEQKLEFPIEDEQPLHEIHQMSPREGFENQNPLLIKIILFSSLAIGLICMVILIASKVVEQK